MIARSYLFVPGDRPERFPKALATNAHRIVIDLEDAVTLEGKDPAREALAAYLNSDINKADRARLIIRVNAHGTPWHEADMRMIKGAHGGAEMAAVTQIMVPKSERREILEEIAAQCHPAVSLIALVETVAGIVRMREIAQAPAVARLAFGSVDYAVDAGVEGNMRELDHVRSCFVIESRHADKEPPIDGVTLAVDDVELIAEDTNLGRRFGFGAKLCIHPKQVDAVNRAFLPSEMEKAWAKRVIDAIAGRPNGAIAVDGKLVDKPIVDRARRILAA